MVCSLTQATSACRGWYYIPPLQMQNAYMHKLLHADMESTPWRGRMQKDAEGMQKAFSTNGAEVRRQSAYD